MDNVDAVVIGAGVVGLAIARALAVRGRETLILESQDRFGTEASSRNSEVIHAGIYYRPNSLKARLCVSGREQLYEFCRQHGVEHRQCGKLIVATSESQLSELERIRSNARANGVELAMLSPSATAALEPSLACAGALSSPLTGIIDSHGYMLALLASAEANGATVAYGSKVTRMWSDAAGVLIAINGETPILRAHTVINSAGLYATHVARSIEGFPGNLIPKAYFAKGTYFTLSGRAPFRHLVYPVPADGASLGIHLTLDLAGRGRFGPDVQWVKECSYDVDPTRSRQFYGPIREYWPALPEGALLPAYSGIRPKIAGPGEAAADFRIDGPAVHGVRGLVNLFGIESPGLTASLAIAEHLLPLTE